jgi:DNA modification methylase
MSVPYYQDDSVTIYHGDCREVMPSLDVASADAMWTDPPYGVSYVGKTIDALVISNDGGDGLAELLRTSWGGVDRVLKPGGRFYIAAPAGPQGTIFRLSIDVANWKFKQALVWVKDSMVLGHSDYHYRHEDILYGIKPGEGRFGRGGDGWYGDNSQTSVFMVARPKRSIEHPTMKPTGLIRRCLLNSTKPGDLVLDPFAGSGSTLRAAKDCNRKAIGIEIEERYCEIAAKRCAQEVLDLGAM